MFEEETQAIEQGLNEVGEALQSALPTVDRPKGDDEEYQIPGTFAATTVGIMLVITAIVVYVATHKATTGKFPGEK